ncbi:FecR family protein [Carboxylicivirga sp. M1479]|uniref:FecR family protein n=1 Tax=Carboxylicivirga sp. M1479 TaxID=2594476 RepID=UPI0011783AEC|nr:FecR domain-containing protein [Carboxylicivirga sp. M1479]TRX62011.1 DUF4974 domain-containing protein [Carboxylicivirga sp. M1479]
MPKQAPIDKILSKLDSSITPQMKRELDEWRKTSADNESFFKAFSFIWSDSSFSKSHFSPNVNKALLKVNKRITRRRIINQIGKVAAILMLFIAIGSTIAILSKKTDQQVIITSNQQQIHLPDSTCVILARGSKITYPIEFNGTKRKVTLIGKAWFDVTHNNKQPFIVETANASTKVLGTEFTIIANSNQATQVFLDKGSVAFKEKRAFSNTYILKPGESIQSIDGQYRIKQLSSRNASAWATKQLRFKNTPLFTVIQEIEDYYNVKVILQTSQIGQLRFSGSIKENSAYDALDIIALTLQLKLKQNNNTLTLSL